MPSFVPFSDYKDGGNVDNPKSIYKAMCVCGHALYLHGFVHGVVGSLDGFWVSQCTSCPVENGEFSCSSFVLDIGKI